MTADQHERVVRDADERRGEHRRERLVVVAVVQQPQVRQEVDHLLLAEVAAARRTVGRQPLGAQRRLVALRVGPGSEEQHDLAGSRRARVDELAHAPRDRVGLALTPRRAGFAVARLVGDEQLDRMAEHGIRELPGRGERLVALAELLVEEVVDGGEHLGPRAVVARQRQPLRRGRAPLAEDVDVGVPEAVDRLELVADEEDVRRTRPAAQQIDRPRTAGGSCPGTRRP